MSAASTSLRPVHDRQFGYDQARHLLWRAGFGGTPEQIQTLASWGPERAVDHVLNVEKVDYPWPAADEFEADIMAPLSDAEQRRVRIAFRDGDEDTLARFRAMRQDRQRRDRRQMREVQRWWLTRMIQTPRPLEEKMTLFWHGHFATSYRTIENSYHMFLQNQRFRRHAVGGYAQLLREIIRDPAMLAYLDNNNSRRGRPNENLARELMELFSLGVGNYTERDIKEGARALTGYTFGHNEFVFDERNHDGGVKSILGQRGTLDGDGFVDAILRQRACGLFMARKLYRFFAADVPDSERQSPAAVNRLIRQLAATLTGANYNVRPMLRRLFLSEHFYSNAVVGEQIKSPAVLIVGAVRSLNTPVRDLSVLLDALGLMGQSLFYPPSVKGWDGGRSWINTSTLFVRQNSLAFLLTGKMPRGYDPLAREERYDPSPLLSELAKATPGAERDPARVVDYLLRFTLGRAPEHGKTTLHGFLAEHDNRITPDIVTGLLLLITAMPEYQLC